VQPVEQVEESSPRSPACRLSHEQRA
jgi:hypothetical protein